MTYISHRKFYAKSAILKIATSIAQGITILFELTPRRNRTEIERT